MSINVDWPYLLLPISTETKSTILLLSHNCNSFKLSYTLLSISSNYGVSTYLFQLDVLSKTLTIAKGTFFNNQSSSVVTLEYWTSQSTFHLYLNSAVSRCLDPCHPWLITLWLNLIKIWISCLYSDDFIQDCTVLFRFPFKTVKFNLKKICLLFLASRAMGSCHCWFSSHHNFSNVQEQCVSSLQLHHLIYSLTKIWFHERIPISISSPVQLEYMSNLRVSSLFSQTRYCKFKLRGLCVYGPSRSIEDMTKKFPSMRAATNHNTYEKNTLTLHLPQLKHHN